MAGALLGFPSASGPYSGLRRSVMDPVAEQPVVTSPPTGAVMQRASVLPICRDDTVRSLPVRRDARTAPSAIRTRRSRAA